MSLLGSGLGLGAGLGAGLGSGLGLGLGLGLGIEVEVIEPAAACRARPPGVAERVCVGGLGARVGALGGLRILRVAAAPPGEARVAQRREARRVVPLPRA
eukprot:scaffold26117_cov56-Phaeocystis_antarctica.AAC.2